jgi:hypothetical protein
MINNTFNMINESHNYGETKPEEPNSSSAIYGIEYYQRPFHLIHNEHARSISNFFLPHPIRSRYWQLVPPGRYGLYQARNYLNSYLNAVEAQLSESINKHSIAYFLHLYRRLSPGPVGTDQQPHTIGLTRAALEAAIQKYASHELCNKIAESATVPINKILGGLLMSPEFKPEKELVLNKNQFVLTDFSSSDLTDFYNLEKLAYEIWKTSAVLRAVGKGAPLIVDNNDEYFSDGRSEELGFLISNYDDRLGRSGWSSTSSGVVYADWEEDTNGCVLLPIYNLDKIPADTFNDFFSTVYKIRFPHSFVSNFLWIPLNLKQYRIAHLPFSVPFYELHHVTLDSVLAVISALCLRVQVLLLQDRFTLIRYYQRAYGISDNSILREELFKLLPQAYTTLGLKESDISRGDFINAIDFWTLDKTKLINIDLPYSGPHYLFLPIHREKVFIDYAWIIRRLYDLFRYVHLDDQNFKGDALEKIVNSGKSVLPTKPCKSLDGEKRQIDYAVSCGSYLVIAECKAVSMSISYDRGDPKAIEFRTNNVINRSLTEVDDKAKWLSTHPKGANYDVSGYSNILPLAISPFVEFMPSKNSRYWLTLNTPIIITPKDFISSGKVHYSSTGSISRVLTPKEFIHFLRELPNTKNILNVFRINH